MRIVIGIDGSDASFVAHTLVATTQWPRNSLIRLLGIHEPGQRAAEIEAMLDQLAEPLRRQGHLVQVRAEVGPPAEQLLAATRELHADLLVVGSRGRGPAASALLGSVSAAVADHATCPVLVARAPHVERMLLATDGSASARAIPAILAQWGVFRHAPVDVVSVAHGPALRTEAFITPWAVDTEVEAPDDVDLARHREIAEDVASQLVEAGWRAEPLVRRGDAGHEILEAARDAGSDLIITGSRGLGDLRRLLVGSVAHHVLLHSRRSVLIMRGHVYAELRDPVPAPIGVLSPAG